MLPWLLPPSEVRGGHVSPVQTEERAVRTLRAGMCAGVGEETAKGQEGNSRRGKKK